MKRNFIMIAMFTCLFEGESSRREDLYYNNLQVSVPSPFKIILVLKVAGEKIVEVWSWVPRFPPLVVCPST
jgi:hypothetical protein